VVAAVAVVSTVAVVSMGEVSAVALSMAVVLVAVVSTGEASAVARSTAVAFVGDVSAVAVSTAVAFVATVLVITDSLMMSSSAASAFPGGGAGAIRTDITVTTITRTITMAMDTAGTLTVTTVAAGTVTTVALVTDSAMAADQGISEVCGGDDKAGYGSLVSGLSACTSIRHRAPLRSSMQFQIVSAAELLRRIGLADVLTPRNLAVELQSAASAVACGRRIKTGEPDE